jgi:hypothetical protein
MAAQVDSRELYLEAKAAFAAAELVFSAKPQPGSPEWDLWSELCSLALQAHDAYLQSLHSDTGLHCSADDSPETSQCRE